MILQAKNISKRYGNHLAVNNIHLQFEKGTFNAILGPNGAGKSTTISVLIGLKQPTQGEIIYEPGTKIGVVFQTSVLDEMLTVRFCAWAWASRSMTYRSSMPKISAAPWWASPIKE